MEMLTGIKPNISKMEIFGSKCFAYVQNKQKLDDRCKEGVFVGYDIASPAYLVYFKNENDVKRVRMVKFIDSSSNYHYNNEMNYPNNIDSEQIEDIFPRQKMRAKICHLNSW